MITVNRFPCIDFTVADHSGSVALVNELPFDDDEASERDEKRPFLLLEVTGTMTSVFFE